MSSTPTRRLLRVHCQNASKKYFTLFLFSFFHSNLQQRPKCNRITLTFYEPSWTRRKMFESVSIFFFFAISRRMIIFLVIRVTWKMIFSTWCLTETKRLSETRIVGRLRTFFNIIITEILKVPGNVIFLAAIPKSGVWKKSIRIPEARKKMNFSWTKIKGS